MQLGTKTSAFRNRPPEEALDAAVGLSSDCYRRFSRPYSRQMRWRAEA